MDILENIVLPQSPTNILLLKYLLFITLLLLLPYLSVMLGTTLFSIMHFSKGKKTSNPTYLKFSKELIDLFTINKGMSFSLGVVPLISFMFIISQIFLNSSLNVTPHLFFATIIFIVSLVYIYTYKYSFSLKNIFNLINQKDVDDQERLEEFEGLAKSNSRLLSKSGWIGFILLLAVVYIVIAVLQIVLDSSRWTGENNIFTLLFSVNTFLYFLFYLMLSFAITCAAIIYKYFKTESKEYDSQYLQYVKDFSLKSGLIFTLIQPFLYALTIISSPRSSLSFSMFIIVTLVIAVMLIISVMFYIMYKESKTNLGANTVLVFLILISLIVYKNQLAFNTSTQPQMVNLDKQYELYVSEVRDKAGIEAIVEINGEDIYNAKCIACHQFEQKLVGPAYNDVLPKYDGKRDELVSYILNPYKIDPEYPAMPNQGLKPMEAEAIADYIVSIYQGQ